MKCSMCGNEFAEPKPDEGLVTAGGWCMPSETLYEMPKSEPMCGDCKSRYPMVLNGLPDPGPNGENLRVPRGGIKYPTPDWKED